MNKYLRDAIESSASKLGYTIVPDWQLTTFRQTAYLKRLFEYCKIDTVIDVGANEGQYRDFLRQEVGHTGDIISVEPIPEMVEKLQERARSDPRWRIEGVALAATPGTATLNVMGSNQFSSLLPPDHSEIGYFATMNSVERTVTVQTRTLNDLVKTIPGAPKRNIYLKLDTQGFDLEVLKGGLDALPRVAALQTEASFKRLYQGAPSYIAVVDFLREHGFDMSAAHPNNDGHFPVLVELDFHLISRDLIPSSHRGA